MFLNVKNSRLHIETTPTLMYREFLPKIFFILQVQSRSLVFSIKICINFLAFTFYPTICYSFYIPLVMVNKKSSYIPILFEFFHNLLSKAIAIPKNIFGNGKLVYFLARSSFHISPQAPVLSAKILSNCHPRLLYRYQ